MSVASQTSTESAAPGATLHTVNPATGENGKAYRAHTLEEASKIAAACGRGARNAAA